MAPFDRPHTSFYSPLMFVSCTVTNLDPVSSVDVTLRFFPKFYHTLPKSLSYCVVQNIAENFKLLRMCAWRNIANVTYSKIRLINWNVYKRECSIAHLNLSTATFKLAHTFYVCNFNFCCFRQVIWIMYSISFFNYCSNIFSKL